MHHLPAEPLPISVLPPVTRRAEYEAARAEVLIREKIPASVTVTGPQGEVAFLDVFAGRRMLVGYFHMWDDGEPWQGQCIGCTYFTAQVQRPQAHLHARDVTLAILCEGTYEESKPYADFMGYTTPWSSARESGPGLLSGREFGWLGCYVRDDEDRVYEMYWTTDRGNEAAFWSYELLDRTVFGRQERWEDSPAG
jgi:predicted dithiol-disulfide oxidoreductase (DUF899 family)